MPQRANQKKQQSSFLSSVQQQQHPLTKNKACNKPTHLANSKRKPQQDTLKFKASISKSTKDETLEYSSELYLFSDGTFDYSIDAYCANDEMGGSYQNHLYGVWQLLLSDLNNNNNTLIDNRDIESNNKDNNKQLIMVPHYQQNREITHLTEWLHFQQKARNNLMIVNDNFNNRNETTCILGWSPEHAYTAMDLENAKLFTVEMTKFE
ncbi:hypothetical protein ABK040_006957 [Willaertia magna]